ncbi:aldehyde dehydrogenase [Trichodelitschia bisporula]|uniref:Aldehyde dehydrogenase n=1 Tax=Trichodelitschia bisporula TaxID=703511 RepID=A0A6G1I3V3_9PEZI|nr:aldehyde dehydrogenase [Trichodelitschia bisporula]
MPDLKVKLTAPNGTEYTQPTGLFISNEWVPSSDGGTITSIDPTTEEVITSVSAATESDIDAAVRAAHRAFKSEWRSFEGTARGALLYELAALVDAHASTLAAIETWDNGKPYTVALTEDLVEVSAVLRYYAGWADKISGKVIDTTSAKLTYTLRQPLGVCAQIIPWNYPLAMAAWKLGPALAAGNTVVLKAAEQTPLSILYLAELVKKAGFPPGVVNVVNGYGRVAGAALVQHPLVAKVAFTGSTATGKEIMKMAAGGLKNITLETGGKSPCLIFADADLDQAVKWAHVGIMSNMGQVCCATSRIYVHEDLYERFLEGFAARVKEVSVIGSPWEEGTFQGPQVTKRQQERVLGYIEAGLSEGARLVTGGKEAAGQGKGFFVAPTVFADVREDMQVVKEEVFGPVVTVSSFKDEDEVLARANDTMYGLGAAVFTADIARAHRIAASLESGTVWVNSSNDGDFRVPFGGVKMSGIGRELGEAGLDGYTSTKAVMVNLGTRL